MTDLGLPFERLFTMPALEGLRSVRTHLLANPGMTIDDATVVVRSVEFDSASLDLEASAVLCALLPPTVPNDGAHFYRGCIREILLAIQPVWARAMLQGCSRFYEALERNEQSLFRQTGILDQPPDDEFVEWWDRLTGEMRLVVDMGKLSQGRAAERLSLTIERERLIGIGISEDPQWIGLYDNTKGYDVLSYDWEAGEVANRLIEVKSTIASPMRFRVTRNEWEQAIRSEPRYLFHIWDMQKNPPVLHMRTVKQVRPHIPTDNEKGKWKDAEIPLVAVS